MLSLINGMVFAGEMGQGCEGGTLTTPCANTAWEFGGKALYLQLASGGISGQRTFTLGDASVTGGLSTQWGFGFALEGIYHFNTGNDVDLNWYHYSHSMSLVQSGTGFFSASNLGIDYLTGLVMVDLFSTLTTPNWDEVNLEFGQLVHYDQNRHIRVHAGLAYTRLNANFQTNVGIVNVPSSGATTSFTIARNVTQGFNGMGPRLGADLTYDFRNSLSVYADGAVAMFVGATKYSDYNNYQNVMISGTNTQVIPGLEAKLGATYSFPMVGGLMKVDAGWIWDSYLGAMSISNPEVFSGPTYHNYTIEGPYLGLRWLGDIG